MEREVFSGRPKHAPPFWIDRCAPVAPSVRRAAAVAEDALDVDALVAVRLRRELRDSVERDLLPAACYTEART